MTDESKAFRVECPACKKVYNGTWSPCVCVQLLWIECNCGVHTKLTTEERKADE